MQDINNYENDKQLNKWDQALIPDDEVQACTEGGRQAAHIESASVAGRSRTSGEEIGIEEGKENSWKHTTACIR